MWRRFCIVFGVIALVIMMTGMPIQRVSAQSPAPNVDGWCRAYGYFGGAFYFGGQWHCMNYGIAYSIADMNVVCQWTFGAAYPIAVFTSSGMYPWVCVPAPGSSLYPQAQESHMSGGVQVFGIKVQTYCDAKGWGGNISEPTDPNKWKCQNGQLVDFSVACPEVWGNARPVAHLADPGNKYGWQCIPMTTPPAVYTPVCTSSFGISVHHWALVVHDIGNRLRKSPAGKLIGIVPNASYVYVIGGPSCSFGLIWWQVLYGGQKGWMAEGNSFQAWLLPY